MKLRSKILHQLPRVYGHLRQLSWGKHPQVEEAFQKAYFFYKRFFEDPFYNLARRHPRLFRGGHVLDVGANIGYTSSVFASAIDPNFRVFAFEPDPENFEILQRIAGRQLAGQIQPVNSAVGHTSGTGTLWVNEMHRGDHRLVTPSFQEHLQADARTVEVPVTTVDEFVTKTLGAAAPVQFVKIDVQGYEVGVLRGAKELLTQKKAHFAVEYMPEGNQELGFNSAELLEIFHRANYQIQRIERSGALVDAGADRIEVWLKERGYIDLLFSSPN